MNYNKKTVRDIDVAGKKVLLRCDFNVPMAKDGSGVITDDKRIRAALPTIQYLLEQNAAVVACSHMGKPKGEVKPELSLKPVAARLSELLGKPVIMAEDVVGPDARAKAAALKPGEILLLENTRFEPGETKNDPALAKAGPLPSTNNMIEGGVNSQLRAVLRNHRGLTSVKRVKAVFWWCHAHSGDARAAREKLATMPTDADMDFLFSVFSASPSRDDGGPEWGDRAVWEDLHHRDPYPFWLD